MENKVCHHNKFGFCKFEKNCMKKHVDVICEKKNCDISQCEKRHPSLCKFYSHYGRCKFMDFCKYKHVKNVQVSSLETEMKEVKSKLKVKDDEIILLANRIDSLSVLVEEQKKQPIIADEIKLLKNRIKTLEAENYVFGEAIDYFDKATKTFLSTAAKGSIQDSSFKDLCQEIALNFWDYIESTI